MKEKLKAEIKRVEALCLYLVHQQNVTLFKMTDDLLLYTAENIKEYAMTVDEGKQLLRDNLTLEGITEEAIQKELKNFHQGRFEKYGFFSSTTLLKINTHALKMLRKLDGE